MLFIFTFHLISIDANFINETAKQNITTKDYEVYKIDLKPLSEVFLVAVGLGLIFAFLMTFMIFVLMCACFVCLNKCCGPKKSQYSGPPPRIVRERMRDARNPREGSDAITSLMSNP